MAITHNTANLILESLVGRNGKKDVSKCYLGLSLTTPTASGEQFTEPAKVIGEKDSGYARVCIGNPDSEGTWLMGAPESGTIKNNATIYFPEALVGWGDVTHFGLFDAAEDGNLMVFGVLTSEKGYVTIEANRVPLFRASDFSLTLQ